MKLKDFRILYIFSELTILDDYENVLATIHNGFSEDYEMPNHVWDSMDKRTELEKWNTYKDCNVLEIRNADIDANWENNYVEIVIDYNKKVKEIPF